VASTGRQSHDAHLSSRSRRRDWQGWRGGKSGSPTEGSGGLRGSEAEDQDLRRAMKEEPAVAAPAMPARTLSSPANAQTRTVTYPLAPQPSPARGPGMLAAPPGIGGAGRVGPASPNTLARQLEMLTGPPPPMTVANLLAWRCDLRNMLRSRDECDVSFGTYETVRTCCA